MNTNPEDNLENQNEESFEDAPAETIDEDEEEFDQATVKSVSMKWGLYVGLIFIAWGIIMQVAGLVGDQTMSYVSYIFLIIGMWMAHKEFKENGNGYMSYSQGLGIGTLMTLIASTISMVFSYIYVKFIDDSMLEIIKEKQMEQMQDGDLSDAQIEQAMEVSAPFMTPEVMFPIALVVTIFVGFLISLIVSAITKNADPSLEV